MQKVAIQKIQPGAIIAKDVLNDTGIMLLSKGTIFRSDFVQRLVDAGINEIYIENTLSNNEDSFILKEDVVLEDVIFEKTRFKAQKQVKKVMSSLSKMGRINILKISALVNEIIEQLLSQKEIILALSNLRSIDNYTYEHSVNVSVLSLIVGIDMNLEKKSLENLGIGAMLHDIGKAAVSEDILKKPVALSTDEFDEIKKHTEYGYKILKNSNIPEEAACIALYHHERYDGTGYNRQLKGENIPLFSRIVAITDVYDAISNDRIYKKKLPPDLVYKEIIHQSNKQFDAEIMEKFVKHIALYPVGTGVILNTNHKGVVIRQNKLLPGSPVIRLFKRENGKTIPVDIDLSKTKYLYIKETF